MRRSLLALALLLAIPLAMMVSACTPVRPVVKIGLAAPFEGLYRETGYTALAAVREAIADCAPDHASVVPLALDTSAQPQIAQRTMQKLLADPTVAVVVGPYSLETVSAVAPQITSGAPVWVVPAAIDASGAFVYSPASLDWLTEFVLEVASKAADFGADAVLVDGIPADWEAQIEANVDQAIPPLPIRFVSLEANDFSKIGPRDAVLWLGQPQLGARIASDLHHAQPTAAFWMGPQGDDPVFAAHYAATGPIFWLSWATPQYNADLQNLSPDTISTHLTYLATCSALAEIYDKSEIDAPPLSLQVFRIDQSGVSEQVALP